MLQYGKYLETNTSHALAGLNAAGKYIFHSISTDLSIGRLFNLLLLFLLHKFTFYVD